MVQYYWPSNRLPIKTGLAVVNNLRKFSPRNFRFASQNLQLLPSAKFSAANFAESFPEAFSFKN